MKVEKRKEPGLQIIWAESRVIIRVLLWIKTKILNSLTKPFIEFGVKK